jgi:nucleoredoxin
MAFKALFGDNLATADGTVDTEEALKGKKAVGIYFSAHWCPPCRGFTPKLAEFYTNGLKEAGMEIVFVSSDRDEGGFKDYFKDMPWLALPFSDRETKAKLSKQFKVSGIPSFVVLDGDGKLSTKDGRSKVMSDPKGENLPWAPKPFADIIGSEFVKADGSTVGKEAIEGKTLLIYFSAHWCPPCRGFTPKLAANYKAYKAKGLNVECIFSTGDRDEASFKDYFKEMADGGGDWLAIPFPDAKRRDELDALFEVQGIPALVVVSDKGVVINPNGRGAIGSDSTGDNFPWAPPAVRNLSQPEGIDESPSICVLMEPVAPTSQKTIEAEMKKVAEQYIKDAGDGNDPKYLFFAGKTSDGPVPQIRTMTGLPAAGGGEGVVATKGDSSPVGIMRSISNDLASHPIMLLLNLDDEGAFYQAEDVEINEESIKAFIKSFEDGKAERKQLKKG